MTLSVSILTTQVNHTYDAPPLSCGAMETMGDRIRRLRESKNWSQQQLADRLVKSGAVSSLTRNAISLWENGGTQNIKLKTFYALVDELGTTPEYLMFGPDRPGGSPAPSSQQIRRGNQS